MLWPHVLVAGLVSIVWINAIISHRSLHPLLHISVAVIVIGSFLLVATEYMAFPDPYDPDLFPRRKLTNRSE